MFYQRFRILVLVTMVGLLAGACATTYEPVPAMNRVEVNADGHAANAENVVVVLDTSSSMAEGDGRHRKFDIATATVRNLVHTLPAEMPIQSALRSFGHDPAFSSEHTIAVSRMDDFNSTALLDALSTITSPGGTSPLGDAISAVADDLDGLDGKKCVDCRKRRQRSGILNAHGSDIGKREIQR
jgi:OOP family OmpA-OmpF porin